MKPISYTHGFQKLLYDDQFWIRYDNWTTNRTRFFRFREYRSRGSLPGKVMLHRFIEEDYRPITKDPRPLKEIAYELCSPVPEE